MNKLFKNKKVCKQIKKSWLRNEKYEKKYNK